ncbi:MAG: tetratricopeptide repeat protein [Bdellovibrionota bacterium]
MASREKLIEKAQKYLQKNKYKDALKIYDKILKQSPDDVRIVLRKGEMEEKLGFTDDAIASYEFVAQRYSDDGFYPKAIAIYKKIIKINAHDMGVHMKLGNLYKKLNIDTEAKMYYTKVAEHYKASGLKSEYLEVVKIISEFSGENTGSKIDLAQEYLEQGDRDQAIGQFRAASQKIYESANVRELDLLVEKMDRLGLEDLDTQQIQIKTYMEAKEPKKALRIIQKAYGAHPTNVDILEMLANCFKELHQPEKATSVYDELIALYKENGELEKGANAQHNKDLLAPHGFSSSVKKQDDQALDDLEGGLENAGASSVEARTEAFGGDDDEDDAVLQELARFDEVPVAEATRRAHEKPKPTASIEDSVIEDLDFIMSHEVSHISEQIEVEGAPIGQDLGQNIPKTQQIKDKKTVKNAGSSDTSSNFDSSFDEFERKPSAEVSHEIELTLDEMDSKISDPYSDDVSELSFQSFAQPIERAEISEEEISGLIDKSVNKSQSDPKDAEQNLLEDDLVLELSEDIQPVESKKEIELTGFDEFRPNTVEKSELSVNEEEFVMIHESLEEASLDAFSDEESLSINLDAPDSDQDDVDSDLDFLTAAGKQSTPQVSDSDLGLDMSIDFKSDEIDMESPSEMSQFNEIEGLDLSDMDSTIDESAEDSMQTQYDPSNQTQVNLSTQDFSSIGDESFEMDLSNVSAQFGEELNEDESIGETLLESAPPPVSERQAAPKTDLDNIEFETNQSFPEYAPTSDGPAPDKMSDPKGGFFDLADSLRDEIDDLERSLRNLKLIKIKS